VAGDFDYVFSGVGAGRLEVGNEDLVQSIAVLVDEFGQRGDAGVEWGFGAADSFYDGAGVPARESNDSESPSARGGREGGDVIVGVHEKSCRTDQSAAKGRE
jgi:hypothetical protein